MNNLEVYHLLDGNYPKQELLITCCNENGALYKLSLEDDKGLVKTLIKGDFRGIAKHEEHYITVSHNRVYLLDDKFQLIKHHKSDGADYHGVAVYGNKAFIVETGNNAIGIYKIPSLARTGEITFGTHGRDFNHINDLFIVQDTIYLSMFSSKTQWREAPQYSGLILEYSLEKNKVQKRFTKLNQPHSVTVHKENLYYCSSLDFEIRKNRKTIFQSFGYLRGLCLEGEMMFIGQSKSRAHMKKVRQDYHNLSYDCGVYVFDLNKKVSRFIHLPSSEVYAILAI